MAGQNILQKLNAARGRAPVGAAGGGIRLGALLGGPVTAAYAIPGFGEQRARNQQEVLNMAKGPLNELRYIGSALSRGQLPYSGTQAGAEQRQNPLLGRVSAPGTDSGWWQGGGGSPGSPAAERAYQTEKSRVAQLTAQDPELRRYANARKAAVAAGPGSAAEQSAEDMGMQMWAKANPKLAAKVKPGQSGYDAIQRMQGVGQMGSPLNLPFDTSSPLGTTPPAPTASYDAGKVAQGMGFSAVPRNAFAGASASPYAAFSQGPTLQSAPLGVPSEMPSASYEGVTGIQPMGSAVEKFDPKGAEAQKLLEMYKNSIFSGQQ
jgi:hypothetical protein